MIPAEAVARSGSAGGAGRRRRRTMEKGGGKRGKLQEQREQYRQGERQEAGAAESLLGKSSLRLYLVECANTVRNGVGAGIGTLVGKACKGALNRSVPTAKYKAGECTCSYEWCGKAGKIRIVCVPAPTKDK